MPELTCTARRIGDYESRTEEYELTFSAGGDPTAQRTLGVKYQAARAYEINAGLDAAVDAAREAIAGAGLDARPSDEALAKFAWRTLQSVKYEEGGSKTGRLEI
ncbi:MAG: hypothetical protein ACR2HO_06725 [Rubrobacteraceae bacterium]|nr:hypothetical protein [Rubrobacter sp.]